MMTMMITTTTPAERIHHRLLVKSFDDNIAICCREAGGRLIHVIIPKINQWWLKRVSTATRESTLFARKHHVMMMQHRLIVSTHAWPNHKIIPYLFFISITCKFLTPSKKGMLTFYSGSEP
jgi:hypothetical protein